MEGRVYCDGRIAICRLVTMSMPGPTAFTCRPAWKSIATAAGAARRDVRGQERTPATAEAALNAFAEKYRVKSGKAVECLTKDRESLLTFYDLPAEHWELLRTTNPIASVFATVRHRTVRTKGSLSSATAKLMVSKLTIAASKTWRRLNGTNQLPKVIGDIRFQDGIEVIEVPAKRAA